MKHTTVIDPHREEEVIIHARRRTKAIEELETFIQEMGTELIGYGKDGNIVRLTPAEVHCFAVVEGKVLAFTDSDHFTVRLPLYAIEEMLDESFVKINQSCLGNVKKIARFDASIGGSLMVTFRNAHRDYVSRRQLKTVKERMKIKS
jgi:DNA-binding LytR/AlgR family response regulator